MSEDQVNALPGKVQDLMTLVDTYPEALGHYLNKSRKITTVAGGVYFPLAAKKKAKELGLSICYPGGRRFKLEGLDLTNADSEPQKLPGIK
jgi:hypothetical protein